jgi:arabinan endo-1,5-alpha-L-arabinosidase
MSMGRLLAAALLASCANDPEAPTDERADEADSADSGSESRRDGSAPVSDASAGRARDAAPAPDLDASRGDTPRVDAAPVRDAAQSDASRGSERDGNLAAPVGDGAVTDGAAADASSCAAGKQTPAALPLRGDLGAHDPAIIRSEGQYYVFTTGRGIPTKRSTDLTNWQRGSAVFAQNPAWVAQRVPGATDLWAPDISFFGGAYHLYYSASTFGSNRSCIGHATRASLSSGAWEDRGAVICSNADGERHDYNAIDPNVALDEAGTPWLSFGSFWSGIKLVKLTLQGVRADTTVQAIAGRANGGAIEAPFIVRHCGEYYLFVSFDTCCKGADSTYRTMVGRARSIVGPYVDRAGVALTRGGGTPVLQGDSRFRGPGHNALLLTEMGDYNVYHAYAASDGHSELRISELGWDEAGWPKSGGP